MAKKTNIGGQAVIEGVMMRGPFKTAIAVRKTDGEIEVSVENSIPLSKRNKIYSLPIIRGIISFFDSLVSGIKYLTYSASFFEDEADETKFDKFLKDKLGEKADSVIMGFTLLLSLVMAMGIFFALPTYAANFLKKLAWSNIAINLFEGVIRMILFLIYIYLISKMKDIQRVFEYHGAEHKSIFCYEAGLPLTPENARQFPRLHPRCGTNFLLIVFIISMIFFSFLGWPNFIMRLVTRIVFLPLIAGLSYELIKWLGRSDSKLAKVLVYPGLMLQKLTTREPDDEQLQVAIESLLKVIPEGESDNW